MVSQSPQKKMNGLQMRRIKLKSNGEVYTISPSYILNYMVAKVSDVENPLFLTKFGVPYWALTKVFGQNDMYWYRLTTSFGRNSLVGTTIRTPDKLPKNLSADEKHTRLNGEKIYAPITVGNHCILGAGVCENADEKDFKKTYEVFAQEARDLSPEYSPETVSTDGFKATDKVWSTIFLQTVIILCFLHSFIKIRQRCRKQKETLKAVSSRVWRAYKAKTKRQFSQRIRRLKEWSLTYFDADSSVGKKVLTLCNKKDRFMLAYNHANAHRTSNMTDRLMRWLSDALFNRQYFHGTLQSANLWIRGRSLVQNFAPICPRAAKYKDSLDCPAKRLNGFVYCDNWLENLIISTSMAGYRQ